ncbi:hypothetical protein B0H11DRAFT_2235963 [Mycena galericulata]|nr:hypothetical protein B0H11DRAFT_2235963 [Mycena galericulata]
MPSGSKKNPFLVPDSPPRPPAAKKIRIFQSPPSTILATLGHSIGRPLLWAPSNAVSVPGPWEARAHREDQEREERRLARRELAFQALLPPAPPRLPAVRGLGATRLIRPPSPTSVAVLGRRPICAQALRLTDLYKDGVLPTEQLPVKIHHKCVFCHLVKSHPVSYLCGHSHCYACIRLWLEKKWTCPECVTPMHRAPFRQYAEEAGLADAYPEWNNKSVVDYSWDGMVFPKPPRRVIVEDSD